jgi:hypothetical protein
MKRGSNNALDDHKQTLRCAKYRFIDSYLTILETKISREVREFYVINSTEVQYIPLCFHHKFLAIET